MQEANTITVRLIGEDLDRLSAEAACRGLTPDRLAAELLHEHLKDDRASKKARALNSLKRLRQLRERRSSKNIDVVALVREGREELGQRGDV
ncbi:hypothetical protein [Synechococcus sp. PCC 7336]|uniref:hypothetical protein n=1 Tax=Synechococcus sp. PCC 7336 TaxID=195250 RepID=UPI000349C5C8|nr:hypothetical protein [Synechococcus sp. PCC 7336]